MSFVTASNLSSEFAFISSTGKQAMAQSVTDVVIKCLRTFIGNVE